jgi:hypothetical protein
MNHDPRRIEGFMSTHGYLLHTYKVKSDAYAIVYTDEAISEDLQKAEGGTGKTIASEFPTIYRNHVLIGGKGFNGDPRFKYSNVKRDTKIIVLDETPDVGLRVSDLYNDISTDLNIDIKSKSKFLIPFDESPKFVITTNTPLIGNGQSDYRRQKVVEFHWNFSPVHTVKDEFGYNFYKKEEIPDNFWLGCDEYAVACVQLYLNKGVISVPINYQLKELIANIGSDVFYFLDSIVKLDQTYNATSLLYGEPSIHGFSGFQRTEMADTRISKQAIKKYFEAYCTYKGLKVEDVRTANGRYFKATKPALESTIS